MAANNAVTVTEKNTKVVKFGTKGEISFAADSEGKGALEVTAPCGDSETLTLEQAQAVRDTLTVLIDLNLTSAQLERLATEFDESAESAFGYNY